MELLTPYYEMQIIELHGIRSLTYLFLTLNNP
jgi:hypothetical protein